jgi:hypothetical protein
MATGLLKDNFFVNEIVARALKVTLFAILFGLFSLKTVAQILPDQWRQVRGKEFSIDLPSRPVGTQESLTKLIEVRRNFGVRDFYALKTDDKQIKCPVAAKLFQRIYWRIVVSNHLRSFIENGPGMDLLVQCEVIAGMGPRTTPTNGVVVTTSILRAEDTEDEISFVLAHEMAHILLGHSELEWDLRAQSKMLNISLDQSSLKRSFLEKSEPEADSLGALLIWNAGYNPYALKTALDKIASSSQGWLTGKVVEYFFNDGHGTHRWRSSNVNKMLMRHHADPNIPFSRPPELSAARHEYDQLNGKH